MLNKGIFSLSDDDLSDLNNDTQYIEGLKRHLAQYKAGLSLDANADKKYTTRCRAPNGSQHDRDRGTSKF